MFTVIWNSFGFHVIDKLRTGGKMESDYFTTNILGPLEQKVLPTGPNPQARRLTIHLENCSIHTSRITEKYIKQHDMIRLQHPPYSLDLAPSDFYLLPTIKEKLKDIQMVDEEDLFHRLQEILNNICHQQLDKVFGTWINRFMIVSRDDGAYIS
jgi:hypothetical protein